MCIFIMCVYIYLYLSIHVRADGGAKITPTTSHLRVSGQKWDVYSLGILFAFIFTEKHPYPEHHQLDILYKVQ